MRLKLQYLTQILRPILLLHCQCCLQVSETVSWQKALVLQFLKHAEKLSKWDGAYLFFQSAPFKEFWDFFQKLTWSQ